MIAERGYGTNEVRAIIADAGKQAVIPSRRSRKAPIPHDPVLHEACNRLERGFDKLDRFRRIETRYDRRGLHVLGFTHLARAVLWMR